MLKNDFNISEPPQPLDYQYGQKHNNHIPSTLAVPTPTATDEMSARVRRGYGVGTDNHRITLICLPYWTDIQNYKPHSKDNLGVVFDMSKEKRF